mgnify:CR=1 FL=1
MLTRKNNFPKILLLITIISAVSIFLTTEPFSNYNSFILILNSFTSIVYLIYRNATNTAINNLKLHLLNIFLNFSIFIVFLLPFFRTMWWILMESAE